MSAILVAFNGPQAGEWHETLRAHASGRELRVWPDAVGNAGDIAYARRGEIAIANLAIGVRSGISAADGKVGHRDIAADGKACGRRCRRGVGGKAAIADLDIGIRPAAGLVRPAVDNRARFRP